MSLKITYLKLNWKLPGANELTRHLYSPKLINGVNADDNNQVPRIDSSRKSGANASGNWTFISIDIGFLPVQRPAIVKTNDGMLWIGPLGTNFNAMILKIQQTSLEINKFDMFYQKTLAILCRSQSVNAVEPH